VTAVNKLRKSGAIQFDDEGKAFWAEPSEAAIAKIHSKVQEVVTKKASEMALKNADQDYLLGNELRQNFSFKAADLGLNIHDYVVESIRFFETYKDTVGEIDDLRAMVVTLGDALKKDFVQAAKLDYYYKFMRYVLYLRSQGMSISKGVTDAFWMDLNNIGEELTVNG